MTTATFAERGLDLRAIVDAIQPGEIRFDPFGLVSGYKSYLIYSALAAKSDADLAAMGLSRQDVPRVAIEAVRATRAA